MPVNEWMLQMFPRFGNKLCKASIRRISEMTSTPVVALTPRMFPSRGSKPLLHYPKDFSHFVETVVSAQGHAGGDASRHWHPLWGRTALGACESIRCPRLLTVFASF